MPCGFIRFSFSDAGFYSLEFKYFHLFYLWISLLGSSLLAVIIESILVSTWGTTLSKSLLSCRVRRRDGTKLGFKQALQRSIFLQVFGMGLNIHWIVTLVKHWQAYGYLKRNGSFYWDSVSNSCVLREKIGTLRLIVTLSLLLGHVVFIFLPQFTQ